MWGEVNRERREKKENRRKTDMRILFFSFWGWWFPFSFYSFNEIPIDYIQELKSVAFIYYLCAVWNGCFAYQMTNIHTLTHRESARMQILCIHWVSNGLWFFTMKMFDSSQYCCKLEIRVKHEFVVIFCMLVRCLLFWWMIKTQKYETNNNNIQSFIQCKRCAVIVVQGVCCRYQSKSD